MNHLVCFVWPSTKKNHAGMSHMCDLLANNHRCEFRLFKIKPRPSRNFSNNIINKVIKYLVRKYYSINYNFKYNSFLKSIKHGDKVFLLDYLMPFCDQREIAVQILKLNANVRIIGLAHLTPSAMLTVLTKEQIREWSTYTDAVMTLGSSLSSFLEACGIDKRKIITAFHYVDHKYYKPSNLNYKISTRNSLRIIIIGNVQRNFIILESIIKKANTMDFTLFTGGNQGLFSVFSKYPNVHLKGYTNENEIRYEMAMADISLNVMEDTVGSNVITTSLAMGLAIVASNVGSIKDYCNENCAIFCNKEEDYVEALNILKNNSDLLSKKKNESLILSKKLHIKNFYNLIRNIEII